MRKPITAKLMMPIKLQFTGKIDLLRWPFSFSFSLPPTYTINRSLENSLLIERNEISLLNEKSCPGNLSKWIIDIYLYHCRCRAPIASLDCMEEFSGTGGQLEFGIFAFYCLFVCLSKSKLKI